MQPKLISLALLLAAPCWLRSAPVTYDEVSLLVRMHESDAYIAQQVAVRRLVRPLTAAQEATLQAQGASAAFLAALRDPNTTLSEAEAVSFDTRRAAQRKAVLDALAADAERERTRSALAAQTGEQEAEAVRERRATEEAARQAGTAPPRRVRAPYAEAPSAGLLPYFLADGTVQRLGDPLFNVNGDVFQQSRSRAFDPNSGVTQRIGNGTVPPKAGVIPSSSAGGTTSRAGNPQGRSTGSTSPAGGSSNRR